MVVVALSIEEKAKKVWDEAEETLKQVDSAHIFSVANQSCREFPIFDAKEITCGPLMGKGGFSNVFEISDITLLDKKEESLQNVKDSPRFKGKQPQSLAFETPTKATTDDARKDDHDEDHYDIDTAREIMSKRCMRFGSARYAMKRLRPDLNELEFARGALDLAIEIKYMSVLMHPNIVKMRGYSNTPRLSLDTFIVMDRLYGTLDERMQTWIQTNAMYKGCCGMTKDSVATQDLLKERLLVAYDLSVALAHMHSLRLLYRDIKPENIGFDIRGDVKVFDFGLVKSLDARYKAKMGAYGYHLTPCTGSIPYMAPEIALKEPYDKEADVFSFCMLLWEIMSMEVLFPDYSIRDYFVRVCKENQRPTIPSNSNNPSWPAVIKAIVKEGWDRNPQKRPDMKRVGTMIRGLLQDMSCGDETIVDRSAHMMDKSRRSFHNTFSEGNGNGSGHSMGDSSSGRKKLTRRRGSSAMATPATTTMKPDGKPSTTKTGGSISVQASDVRRESLHLNLDLSELEDVLPS
ncbi:protein kinase domain containing protein [Nitzschia inconspicua]|uniref:Protein kinase domain containing protein n=1 Tax=Nitzschia inconspicua TaxID=303405 RepID=A0A9K3KV66_9STRA|nr:protein kinase domain containing protein [Nitzschia inconspicua]